MLGQLSTEEIEDVLRTEVVARLAYIAEGRPWIVPVTYLYDGESVYVHSADGAKIRAMRENPNVCLEVEQLKSMMDWRTVVAQGRFEMLWPDADERVMDLLSARFAPMQVSQTARPAPARSEEVHRREGIARSLVYRVRLLSKTGRFELR